MNTVRMILCGNVEDSRKFYMEYVTPLDVDLTSLEHYPSIEISKNDLQ